MSSTSSRDDIYWCAADIGWVTGHSYIVYGPLCNGATSIMYEGTPHPGDQDRWWKIIQEFKVNILYTAPTTIRTLMKWGHELLEPYDLSSLRVLGSVGEPINPEAWMWYRTYVGGGSAPIVDTWWQTETGAIMISPLPGVTSTKPGAAMRPLPGISAEVVDNDGKPLGPGNGGAARPHRAVAVNAARHLGRPRSATRRRTGRGSPDAISPVTARSSTRTATCGCSAASTTS